MKQSPHPRIRNSASKPEQPAVPDFNSIEGLAELLGKLKEIYKTGFTGILRNFSAEGKGTAILIETQMILEAEQLLEQVESKLLPHTVHLPNGTTSAIIMQFQATQKHNALIELKEDKSLHLNQPEQLKKGLYSGHVIVKNLADCQSLHASGHIFVTGQISETAIAQTRAGNIYCSILKGGAAAPHGTVVATLAIGQNAQAIAENICIEKSAGVNKENFRGIRADSKIILGEQLNQRASQTR